MRKNTTHILNLRSGLWQIGIVNDQAYMLIALFVFVSQYNLIKQLQVNTVNNFAPVEGSVFHEPVENIFPTGYKPEKRGLRIMISIFDHE